MFICSKQINRKHSFLTNNYISVFKTTLLRRPAELRFKQGTGPLRGSKLDDRATSKASSCSSTLLSANTKLPGPGSAARTRGAGTGRSPCAPALPSRDNEPHPGPAAPPGPGAALRVRSQRVAAASGANTKAPRGSPSRQRQSQNQAAGAISRKSDEEGTPAPGLPG